MKHGPGGYEKTFTVRIIRTKHRITFTDRTTAADLREFLSHVPDDATFDDMEWADDGASSSMHYIEFHHEKAESE